MSRPQAAIAALAGAFATAVASAFAVGATGAATGASPQVTQPRTIWTIAGTGSYGGSDGPAAAASFNAPFGVAVDPRGNVYVGDYNNNRIRRVSPAGVVSTLAGSGVTGSADGPASAATFATPFGVAADSRGDVFVADQHNQKIREITPAGVVRTFAGSGADGRADGPAATASFSFPTGVAVDAHGDVFVADQGNNLVRRIARDGTVTTLAGGGSAGAANGRGAAASFNAPAGIAVDGRGRVFVADTANNRIREITPDGRVGTLGGSGATGHADGSAAAATFAAPTGVAVDALGGVYVADRDNNRIRRITGGRVTTVAGTGVACATHPLCADGGAGTRGLLNGPWGVAVDRSGAVFVADTYDKEIRWLTDRRAGVAARRLAVRCRPAAGLPAGASPVVVIRARPRGCSASRRIGR